MKVVSLFCAVIFIIAFLVFLGLGFYYMFANINLSIDYNLSRPMRFGTDFYTYTVNSVINTGINIVNAIRAVACFVIAFGSLISGTLIGFLGSKKESNQIIEKRDRVNNVENELVAIEKKDKPDFANTENKTVDTPVEVEKEKVTKYKVISDGLISVKQNGKWGFMDENDNTVIPFIYDDVTDFSNGLAHVKLNEEWFYINKKGERVKKD